MDTVDIKGVELAKVGVWAGGDGRGRPTQLDISREDLAAAVEAYEFALAEGGASAAEVPIKLGHTMAQEVFGKLADQMADGAPAYGWVGNLRLKGDTLVGDYLRVPAKLAGMMKSGAWRNRSIEFYRNTKWPLSASGKTFRMVMSAVAVLGATAPAVKGLADIFAAAEGDAPGERFFTAAEADEPMTEAQAERMIAKWEAMLADLEPLFRGRAGAPMFRSFATASVQQLRRIARFQPAPQEGQMRAATLAMLGLPEDATNEAALAALSTAKPAALGGLYTLALNADAALAVLAEILGVPGATPDDVIAKVRELTGGEPADPNAPGGDPAATPPGGGTMSDVSNAALLARVEAAERKANEADVRAAKVEASAAATAARARVERDVSTLSLPASISETLFRCALRGDEDSYKEIVATLPRVPTGEKGTASAIDANDAPSDDALAAATAMGFSKEAAFELLTGKPLKAEA